MDIKRLVRSMISSIAKGVEPRSVLQVVETSNKASDEAENIGNVAPDRRSIQTSTGKLYPPNMSKTQPGEYGLRARGGTQYQEALGLLISENHRVWSGAVTVSIVGKSSYPSLEIKRGSDVLGVVTSATLLEHPLALKAVRDGKAFRGSTEDGSPGGLFVRIFFNL